MPRVQKTDPDTPVTPLRAFSFGAGVQSVACLVLAAQGRIDYRTFLFANVGEDSEHPDTLAYLREHAIPFARKHGLQLEVLERRKRDGSLDTVYSRVMAEGSKSMPLPVRFKKGGLPGTRNCTMEFKIMVVQKWLKQRGASPDNPAVTGIGISVDEFQRMRDAKQKYQVLDYPLIELGLTRTDCKRIIAEAGLPVPPRSACYFCPLHDLESWKELYDQSPNLFAQAVAMEATINGRRKESGKDPIWFTRYGMPLDQVVNGSHRWQMDLFPPEEKHSCAPFVCSAG